ncbi:MAG: hypothetical protein AAFP98_06645 [Pseudomonadota bacterium]
MKEGHAPFATDDSEFTYSASTALAFYSAIYMIAICRCRCPTLR